MIHGLYFEAREAARLAAGRERKGASARSAVTLVLGAPASRDTPTQTTSPSGGPVWRGDYRDTLVSPHFLALSSARMHLSGNILIRLAKPFLADGRAK
jgi:hypothetical protein